MSTSLVGMRVLVTFSDPWQFVTDNGESRSGTVVDEDNGTAESSLTLGIRLDKKIAYLGIEADFVYAKFRHLTSTKQQLLSGSLLPCSFSTELTDASLSPAPGAIAFIGGLRRLS